MIKHFPSTSTFLSIFLIAVILPVVSANAATPLSPAGYSPLLISVADALKAKRDNPRTIFIDVRGEDAFQKIHIPDSINVPLHFVKTKSYLRNMHVILVSQGDLRSNLLQQAELLNKKGIKTAVLAGGLAGWSQKKNPLTGSELQRRDILHHVQPSLFSVAEFSRFIDISSEKTTGDSPLLSRAKHVPVNTLDDLSALVAVIDEEGQSPLATVLLFNQDGDYSLLGGLADKCQTTLFFLLDGSKGYDRVSRQQQAILEPKAERMKTIGGCSTCPAADSGLRRSN